MDSDVQFVCCDNPHATRFTLHILAAVAENEAAMISARTKAALVAAKARGQRLGGWRGRHFTEGDTARAREARTAKAKARADQVMPVIVELREQGKMTLRELADGLNSMGVRAPRGGQWHAATVRATLQQVS
jgi:DNA invertase Pin-like site-specific DNA recombinase